MKMFGCYFQGSSEVSGAKDAISPQMGTVDCSDGLQRRKGQGQKGCVDPGSFLGSRGIVRNSLRLNEQANRSTLWLQAAESPTPSRLCKEKLVFLPQWKTQS